MRPRSIIMFDRLFLASLLVSVIAFVVGYDATMAELEGDPAVAALGSGSAGVMIASVVVGLGISLLLWYLVAYKASRVAKWILVALFAFSLVSLLMTVGGVWDVRLLLSAAVYALQGAALVFLFKPDAKAWFKGEWNVDSTTFD